MSSTSGDDTPIGKKKDEDFELSQAASMKSSMGDSQEGSANSRSSSAEQKGKSRKQRLMEKLKGGKQVSKKDKKKKKKEKEIILQSEEEEEEKDTDANSVLNFDQEQKEPLT